MSKKLKKHTSKSTNPKDITKKKKKANIDKMSASQGKKSRVKETSVFLYYLLVPSILVTLSTQVIPYTDQLWLVIVYLTTLIGIVLFFVFKLHHQKLKNLALLIGLALSPLYTFIHEARTIVLATRIREGHDIEAALAIDFFPYFNTIFAFFFYTLPFLFIAGVALVVMVTLKAREDLSVDL